MDLATNGQKCDDSRRDLEPTRIRVAGAPVAKGVLWPVTFDIEHADVDVAEEVAVDDVA